MLSHLHDAAAAQFAVITLAVNLHLPASQALQMPASELIAVALEQFSGVFLRKIFELQQNIRPAMFNRLDEIIDELVKKDYSSVVVFAHGGVINCFRVYFGQTDLQGAFDKLAEYGEILEFESN